MHYLETAQAQLLRLLGDFFGSDQVIPFMSISSVFTDLVADLYNYAEEFDGSCNQEWLKREKCLFTIIDAEGDPKLVIELSAGDIDPIDLVNLKKQDILEELCSEAKICFALISHHELAQILDPSSRVSLISCLSSKLVNEELFPLGF